MQWSPPQPVAIRSWSTMPQRATRLRFCGWPRLPVRILTSSAPSSRRMAEKENGAAERVGVSHPLGEDVGPAAADGLGAALQAHVGALGRGQDAEVLHRAALAEDALETPAHDVRPGWAGAARGFGRCGSSPRLPSPRRAFRWMGAHERRATSSHDRDSSIAHGAIPGRIPSTTRRGVSRGGPPCGRLVPGEDPGCRPSRKNASASPAGCNLFAATS